MPLPDSKVMLLSIYLNTITFLLLNLYQILIFSPILPRLLLVKFLNLFLSCWHFLWPWSPAYVCTIKSAFLYVYLLWWKSLISVFLSLLASFLRYLKLLKKSNLKQYDSQGRPIYQLSFLCKLTEKAVKCHLTDYLSPNILLNCLLYVLLYWYYSWSHHSGYGSTTGQCPLSSWCFFCLWLYW